MCTKLQIKHTHNRLTAFLVIIVSGFCGAGDDNGDRGTDSPGGRHPIQTNFATIPITFPHFTPNALPAATLPISPGLGQAPIYAGLHTRWLGSN